MVNKVLIDKSRMPAERCSTVLHNSVAMYEEKLPICTARAAHGRDVNPGSNHFAHGALLPLRSAQWSTGMVCRQPFTKTRAMPKKRAHQGSARFRIAASQRPE
ncbi:MAG: hypothetical protein L0I62_00010 [Gammaproteobacteria bacterium]|nr:hypothetical protein [Gammaproteobacteria bacterium]